MKGHFKNPIYKFDIKLEKKADIDSFFSNVGRENLQKMIDEIDVRSDENGVFSIRFNKQKAYAGSLEIGSGSDVISVKVKPRVYRKGRENSIETLREYLEKYVT